MVKLRLAAELEDHRAALDRLAAAVVSLRHPTSDARGEWMRTLALAFEAERFYTAVESVLARVLRTLDGELPVGGARHLELLRAAAVAIPGGRPALINDDTAKLLRELLKFRHLARHGYADEPVLALMEEHADRIAAAHAGLLGSLGVLERWLRA